MESVMRKGYTKPTAKTDAEILAMANTGVSDASTDQTVAERSGSDDKVGAVKAEGAKPTVPTYTPEARVWIENNKDLNTEGLFGQRGQLALHPEDLKIRAQFLGHPLTVADMEELYSLDPSAPTSFVSTVSGETLTSFIRIPMVNRKTGDLQRNKAGEVTYRGQFVVTGKPLAIHASETGDNLFQLRNARKLKKELPNGRQVADLLYCQSFDQASARLAGIQAKFQAQADEKNAMNSRLGFKVGDAARHSGDGSRTDDGIDRGPQFTPRQARGQGSRRTRRWSEDVVSQ